MKRIKNQIKSRVNDDSSKNLILIKPFQYARSRELREKITISLPKGTVERNVRHDGRDGLQEDASYKIRFIFILYLFNWRQFEKFIIWKVLLLFIDIFRRFL